MVGIAGYFLRRHVLETVPTVKRQRAPIVETLHDHWRLVLALAGLSVFNAVGFYISFVYLVSWLQLADGIAPARALEINSVSMAVLLPVMIVTGCWPTASVASPFSCWRAFSASSARCRCSG